MPMSVPMAPRRSTERPLRVLYLAGPGDAPNVLRRRAAGDRFDEVAHQPYSAQLFDACEEVGAQVLSVSWHARDDDFRHGNIRALNRSHHLNGKSGLRYHAANARFAFDVARDVWREGADVLLTSTEPHPFLLEPLIARGLKVVTAIHATLLPVFQQPGRGTKLALQLGRHFYEKSCFAILSHPGPCTTQIVELTHGKHRPIVEFLPLYQADFFSGVTPPPKREPGQKFRIIQVGRLEANKGVFDLIEVARRAKRDGRTDLHFDVCGTGGALEDARRKVKELALEDTFILHGWTEMARLRQLWSESHAAVVATTTGFVEGFNQVIVEALLVGRPIVTSRVCPSLEFARESALEAPPNDPGAYYQQLVRLADDRALYDRLQANCAEQASVFLDPSKSFHAGLTKILGAIMDGREIESVWHPPGKVDKPVDRAPS
jgi:glycogen synthase